MCFCNLMDCADRNHAYGVANTTPAPRNVVRCATGRFVMRTVRRSCHVDTNVWDSVASLTLAFAGHVMTTLVLHTLLI